MKKALACIIFALGLAGNAHARNSIDAEMKTDEVCRFIFTNTDDQPLYRDCRRASRYESWADGSRAFKYTFISIGFTIGFIGIFPYAGSGDTALFLVGGGFAALGLLAWLPQWFFESRAESNRREVIDRYNATWARDQVWRSPSAEFRITSRW